MSIIEKHLSSARNSILGYSILAVSSFCIGGCSNEVDAEETHRMSVDPQLTSNSNCRCVALAALVKEHRLPQSVRIRTIDEDGVQGVEVYKLDLQNMPRKRIALITWPDGPGEKLDIATDLAREVGDASGTIAVAACNWFDQHNAPTDFDLVIVAHKELHHATVLEHPGKPGGHTTLVFDARYNLIRVIAGE